MDAVQNEKGDDKTRDGVVSKIAHLRTESTRALVCGGHSCLWCISCRTSSGHIMCMGAENDVSRMSWSYQSNFFVSKG